MSARRVTNNSVSTLDEQNDVLQSILSKESASKPPEKADKKKSRKKKEKCSATQVKRQKLAADLVDLEPRMADHAPVQGAVGGLDPDEEGQAQVWPTWSQAQAAVAGVPASVLGNAVPGYRFGEIEQPDWAEEEEPIMEDIQVDRNVHDMSEDEDSEEVAESEIEQEQVIPPSVVVPEIKKTGIFADILKENLNKVKESDKVAKKLTPEVAFGVEKYLKECLYTTEMEKLAKFHPRVDNVESMKVPRLDMEVYQVIDQKVRNMDQTLQSIQKGVVGAISALSPLLELGFDRADSDKEFDDCARGLWESVQLMSFVLNGISARRRELIKPCLAPIYAQVLTKGHETSPEWLYGGNLLETTKKCEVAKKISEKILNKKSQPQKPANQARGGKQASRGRGRGQLRAFNPHQSYRQNQQHYQIPVQNMGFPLEYPRYQKPQYQGYGQQQQQQYQGPNHLMFPKNKNNNVQK